MQTVGEMLREERERKGLTLKDVETATNIRSAYLNAIEEGNYSVLPGEVYVKGFIRNYANALGLNGSEYVEHYRNSQQPIEPPSTEPVEEKADEEQTTSPSVVSTSAASRRRQRSRKTEVAWIGVLLLLLALGGGIWWYMFAAKESPKPQTPQQQPAPSGSVKIQPPVQVAPAPVKPAERPVAITAKFLNRSWIQVTADDKEVYEGIPQSGESMTWQANQKIMMKVGNAGAVEVTHNGQAIGKLGGNGEVVLKTFTASGRQ